MSEIKDTIYPLYINRFNPHDSESDISKLIRSSPKFKWSMKYLPIFIQRMKRHDYEKDLLTRMFEKLIAYSKYTDVVGGYMLSKSSKFKQLFKDDLYKEFGDYKRVILIEVIKIHQLSVYDDSLEFITDIINTHNKYSMFDSDIESYYKRFLLYDHVREYSIEYLAMATVVDFMFACNDLWIDEDELTPTCELDDSSIVILPGFESLISDEQLNLIDAIAMWLKKSNYIIDFKPCNEDYNTHVLRVNGIIVNELKDLQVLVTCTGDANDCFGIISGGNINELYNAFVVLYKKLAHDLNLYQDNEDKEDKDEF